MIRSFARLRVYVFTVAAAIALSVAAFADARVLIPMD